MRGGIEFTITKHSKPIANFVPFTSDKSGTERKKILEAFEDIRASVKSSASIKQYVAGGRKHQ